MSSDPWATIMPGGIPFSRAEEAAADASEEAAVEAAVETVVEDAGLVEDVEVSTDVDTAPVEVVAPTGLPVTPVSLPVAPTLPVAAPSLPVTPTPAAVPTEHPQQADQVEQAVGAEESEPTEADEPDTVEAEWDALGDDEEPSVSQRLGSLPGSPLAPLPGAVSPVEATALPTEVPAPVPAGSGEVPSLPVAAPSLPVAPSVETTTAPTPAAGYSSSGQGDEVVEVDGMWVNPTTGQIVEPSTPPVATPAKALPVTPPVLPAPGVGVTPVPSTVPSTPGVPTVDLVPAEQPKREVPDVGEDWSADDLLNDNSEDAATERKDVKAQKRKAKASKKKSTSLALTERDYQILQFLARYRYATYPQLARYFETTPMAMRQRMPRLAREGLVVRKIVGHLQHGVWLPTESGMKVSGLDVPTPTLSWGTAPHTLGLVDIGVKYELEEEQVVTEREIRAADQRDRPSPRMRAALLHAGHNPDEPIEDGSPRLYVVPLGSGESHYGHIPDMVLARPSHPDGSAASVAIELELNHKPATQWRKILKAYLNAPNIGEVIYYTSERKIASGIARAAREIGADHMVTVRRFHTSESSAIIEINAS